MNFQLDINQAQIIVTALQKSDPMGMYTTDLVTSLVDQANAQIKQQEEAKNEVTETSRA